MRSHRASRTKSRCEINGELYAARPTEHQRGPAASIQDRIEAWRCRLACREPPVNPVRAARSNSSIAVNGDFEALDRSSIRTSDSNIESCDSRRRRDSATPRSEHPAAGPAIATHLGAKSAIAIKETIRLMHAEIATGDRWAAEMFDPVLQTARQSTASISRWKRMSIAGGSRKCRE